MRMNNGGSALTSPTFLVTPFCSSNDLAWLMPPLTLDWTFPEMVWSGPRAFCPRVESIEWKKSTKRFEMPCFSIRDKNRRTVVMKIDGDRAINTHCPTQWHVARPDQRARSPWRDTRPQLEKASNWFAPCHRNLGTRTRCARLISLVEAFPWRGRLVLALIVLDRVRSDGEMSVVECPSIELHNECISRRSWFPVQQDGVHHQRSLCGCCLLKVDHG